MIPALWQAARGFVAHQGFFLAAGVSFYFLSCVVPLLFLLISVAGFVLTSEAIAGAVLHQLAIVVPVYREEMKDLLTQIIATRKVSGLLGTATLLLFSTQLFAALRFALNTVFGVKRSRGLVRDLVRDVVMVFVMGALFVATIGVSEAVEWFRVFVAQPVHMPRRWIRWVQIGASVASNSALLCIAYRYFPSRPIMLRAALVGAVLASGLWEVARQVFRWYIVSFGVFDRIYGPLGALVALSMFAYYTGTVFLVGAEYAAAVEARWRSRR